MTTFSSHKEIEYHKKLNFMLVSTLLKNIKFIRISPKLLHTEIKAEKEHSSFI
jgi:hypothetical protein